MIEAWKFLRESRCLGYDDNRPVKVGVPLEIDGLPILCARGIHASRRAIDALQYAESAIVARVHCEGEIVEGDDKLACTRLTPLAIFDATDTLRHFARLCALDVIHLWDAPEIVRRYLETGEGSIRAAALAAAWAAARTGARAATWAAARAVSRNDAWNAARDAAWYAARAAAWNDAWNAARGAARDDALAAAREDAMAAQNVRLEQMLTENMERKTQCTTVHR